jgi:mRNA-degrading endonuclease RelE of RelBE toxin-antitoxin system
MGSSKAYEIQLTKSAAKQLRQLGGVESARVSASLSRLAARAGSSTGSRGGKSVKQVRGRHDRFQRLRIGELRVVFELLDGDDAVLVHGIVNRRDLDRWLRSR